MRNIIAEGFIRQGIRALAFVSILAVSAGCASADTLWTLVGVKFSDGATATGTFSVDPTDIFLTGFNITLSGTSLSVPYPTVEFIHGISSDHSSIPTDVLLADFLVTGDYMELVPSSALTSLGGTIPLAIGSITDPTDCYGGPCGYLTGGEITTSPDTALPEPGTLSLMGAALAGIGLLARKRAA
jgi:hypothetical protein